MKSADADFDRANTPQAIITKRNDDLMANLMLRLLSNAWLATARNGSLYFIAVLLFCVRVVFRWRLFGGFGLDSHG
jgi:hypothetical protein